MFVVGRHLAHLRVQRSNINQVIRAVLEANIFPVLDWPWGFKR